MITLQFHPDWPYGSTTVIESMVADGIYLSQFSTGTSNGGLTAHPGGDRWRWESRLFAGRYDDAPAETRPVYGAWNRHASPYGGAIRFGTSYVRLRPEVGDLDDAVEAHVHGGVRFTTDVEAVVLDPSFRGTATATAANRLGCPVEYHPGFQVRADAIGPSYRGAHIVEPAGEVSRVCGWSLRCG